MLSLVGLKVSPHRLVYEYIQHFYKFTIREVLGPIIMSFFQNLEVSEEHSRKTGSAILTIERLTFSSHDPVYACIKNRANLPYKKLQD